ncbi:STAS domain-containing protein [Geomicrobium sp. JCM 19039]|uniref:STAS domain-containing protein n=1 Tax=Geomicrobium sp. JCM 19039 TaxID=1460636 RepID=UPI00045F2071|nr:STAS domain-containing protein [Geomicrobium sp. JCM 19039]GAK14321.1 GGDEF domain protein [Geomicrobium sp. JCM 19039]
MTKHQSLLDTSNKLFAILTKELNVNTVYIARRDEKVMTVINARNEDRTIVTPSMQVSYDDSNCRYVHENPSGTRSFKNLMTDSETKDRPITEQLQVKTFLGITIQRMNGVPFGTLCIMDPEEKTFTDDQVAFVESFAYVLSYMIELDETIHDLELISVPIMPLTPELAILALQGNINDRRASKIMEDTLHYASEKRIRHFVIDLSEMLHTEQSSVDLLKRLVSALRLMGVRVILSGIPVSLAKDSTTIELLNKLDVDYVSRLENALPRLGFEITKVGTPS